MYLLNNVNILPPSSSLPTDAHNEVFADGALSELVLGRVFFDVGDGVWASCA